MNKKPFYPAILILCVLIAYFLEKKYGFQDPWIIIHFIFLVYLPYGFWYQDIEPNTTELGSETTPNIDPQIALRRNASNPLYKYGYLMEKPKGILKLSKFRGIRFTQIIAAIQICFLSGRILFFLGNWISYIDIYPNIVLKLDPVLFWWVVSNCVLCAIIKTFYNNFLHKKRKKIFQSLSKKNILSNRNVENNKPQIYSYLKELEPQDFLNETAFNFNRKYRGTWKKLESYGGIKKNLIVCLAEDEYNCKTWILVQMYSEQFCLKQIDVFNEFVKEFIKNGIKEHSLPLVQPCFICVIYAEQMLGTLMSAVQDNSTYGTYKKLVAGVALNEKKIYISSDDQTGDLELMRKILLNMFKESVYKISL